jgi:hypothetical protein
MVLLKVQSSTEKHGSFAAPTHKYVAIAAPRGHAKSSGVTLGYGLSTLLFRERKFHAPCV